MSTAEANMQGEYLVGGIAGENQNSNIVTDCYNLTPVTATGGTAKESDDAEPWGSFTGGIVRI